MASLAPSVTPSSATFASTLPPFRALGANGGLRIQEVPGTLTEPEIEERAFKLASLHNWDEIAVLNLHPQAAGRELTLFDQSAVIADALRMIHKRPTLRPTRAERQGLADVVRTLPQYAPEPESRGGLHPVAKFLLFLVVLFLVVEAAFTLDPLRWAR